MLRLGGSKDLGPDPEFLIPLRQTREGRGRTIPKVTQQVRTGLRQESLPCAPALVEAAHVQAERAVAGVSTQSGVGRSGGT